MAHRSVNDSGSMDPSSMIFSVPNSSNDHFPASWIISSGASFHITCSLNISLNTFTDNKNLVDKLVFLPNNSRGQVQATGTVSLTLSQILHNVLFIPDFRINLIFVSALVQCSNFSLSFINGSANKHKRGRFAKLSSLMVSMFLKQQLPQMCLFTQILFQLVILFLGVILFQIQLSLLDMLG